MRGSSGGSIPEGRDIVSELTDEDELVRGERGRELFEETLVILLKLMKREEIGFPGLSELTSDEAIFGFNGMVVTSRAIAIQRGAFDSGLPKLVNLESLLMEMFSSLEGEIDSSGLESKEELVRDKKIERSACERLTGRTCVISSKSTAGIRKALGGGVIGSEVIATFLANEETLEESNAIADSAWMGSAVLVSV